MEVQTRGNRSSALLMENVVCAIYQKLGILTLGGQGGPWQKEIIFRYPLARSHKPKALAKRSRRYRDAESTPPSPARPNAAHGQNRRSRRQVCQSLVQTRSTQSRADPQRRTQLSARRRRCVVAINGGSGQTCKIKLDLTRMLARIMGRPGISFNGLTGLHGRLA